MATPSVVEKCRRGRPNEGKRTNWMSLGYGSFGDCLSRESAPDRGSMANRMARWSSQRGMSDESLPQQVCGNVRYAFKTSDRLFDSLRAMNLTGVDKQHEKELELITDTLQEATTKCNMMGPE